eukprot:6201358-Pleurochrysis_carterae.AAC.1
MAPGAEGLSRYADTPSKPVSGIQQRCHAALSLRMVPGLSLDVCRAATQPSSFFCKSSVASLA